ncbi:MAG: sensor histidine kinase [Blastocatellales bacterium]
MLLDQEDNPYVQSESKTILRKVMPARWLLRWLAMFGLLAFVGLAFSIATYVSNLSGERPLTVFSALVLQLMHFLIWAAMCPAFIWLDQRVRAVERRWWQIIVFHVLAGIVFSVIQIAIFGWLFWTLLDLTVFNYSSLRELYWSVAPARIVLGIVIYKIIVTTNYALDYYDKYNAEKHRTALLEAYLAQSQLQALKMQLQPHFLFNTLNSISSLVLDEPKAAVQMIARLGDFLRLTIENNGTQEVSLERELEFLKCYLEIQQVRFRDRLKVKIEIEPQALDARVPNLILQPIVENAIKHGIALQAAAGQIQIKAGFEDDKLKVQVSNDGPCRNGNGHQKKNRIHSTALATGQGVGIANTRERLRQLYQDQFQLELTTFDEGGAVCVMEIPVVAAVDNMAGVKNG